MGCMASAETKTNKDIDAAQKADQRKEARIVKLLLLGAGESGKSTLFKQMKLLYGVPYQSEELKKMIPVVHLNIMTNLLVLLKAAPTLGVTFDDEEARTKFIEEFNDRTVITPEVSKRIFNMWIDNGCVASWNLRAKIQVLDCLAYYCTKENLDRISSPEYEPIEADVLNARVRTSGVVEEKYVIEGAHFNVFDVGGQRNERKKWIHCFEDVTALIFVTAVNEYDQVLFEDSHVPRIQESLILFEEVVNSQWFEETSLILFLNKVDLYREKLKKFPIKVKGERFEDFDGPYVEPGTASSQDGTAEFEACYKAGLDYFAKKFLSKCRHKRQIYTHFTCATDNKTTKAVFRAVKDTILRSNLADTGFMT